MLFAGQVARLMGLGFKREEIRYLSAAQWDAFYRVTEMDVVYEYQAFHNATRAAYHSRESYRTDAWTRARLDALTFNREIDEKALAEEIALRSEGESVGELPSPASHRGVGIDVVSSDEDLLKLPPHIAAQVRKQHERAKAKAQASPPPVETPSPSVEDLNAELM